MRSTNSQAVAGKAEIRKAPAQEIELCRNDGLADFDKDPDRYMAKLRGAK